MNPLIYSWESSWLPYFKSIVVRNRLSWSKYLNSKWYNAKASLNIILFYAHKIRLHLLPDIYDTNSFYELSKFLHKCILLGKLIEFLLHITHIIMCLFDTRHGSWWPMASASCLRWTTLWWWWMAGCQRWAPTRSCLIKMGPLQSFWGTMPWKTSWRKRRQLVLHQPWVDIVLFKTLLYDTSIAMFFQMSLKMRNSLMTPLATTRTWWTKSQ